MINALQMIVTAVGFIELININTRTTFPIIVPDNC